ncbi:MAG: methylamine utilization protein MauE [Rhizobium sp.]|nr:MAG: methylamine utilization protein MauE [Rhizobium sp.]
MTAILLATAMACAVAVHVFIGSLFMVAGVAKLRDPAAFRAAVANYGILQRAGVGPVAVLLPVVEIVGGGMLALRVALPASALLIAVLLIVFAASMAVNLLRGRRNMDCGCTLGVRGQPISWALVVRNLGLVVMCVVATLPQGPPQPTLALTSSWIAGILLLLWYQLVTAIVTLQLPDTWKKHSKSAWMNA